MRKAILKIYGVILAIGIPYYLIVSLTGFGLPCATYSATGRLCPGCGSSRMFLALARLDLSAAFAWNPVVFVLFFVWNAIGLLCFCGKPAFVRNSHFLYTCLGLSIGALVLFGILRNIP